MINRNFRCFLITSFLVFAIFAGFVPASAIDLDALTFPPLGPIELPEIEEVKLENGMRLYLLEDHSLPLIEASVRIHGGSYLEPAEKIGLANFVGELLRAGGTENGALTNSMNCSKESVPLPKPAAI